MNESKPADHTLTLTVLGIGALVLLLAFVGLFGLGVYQWAFGTTVLGGATGVITQSPAITAQQLQTLQTAYLQHEGHQNRADHFSQLSLQLHLYANQGNPVSEAQMVKWLGPPDRMWRQPSEDLFVYFATVQGQKVACHITYQQGQQTKFGVGDRSQNQTMYDSMLAYTPPQATPATQPAPPATPQAVPSVTTP